MSEASKFVAESLEELLAGIADGVREAQASLSSAAPFDQYGRPLPTYHLPYVDFDIKVDMRSDESPSGLRSIKFLPIGNNKSQSKEITSSISGRFVAIPPGDGLPITLLQLTSTRQGARKHLIEVRASNSAGEILQNSQVEINLNLVMSQQLSISDDIRLSGLKTSKLSNAILLTDSQGLASTELTIDSSLPAKASIVISAELDQRVTNIVVAAGNES